jgi:lysophospholipase L1-like esterase
MQRKREAASLQNPHWRVSIRQTPIVALRFFEPGGKTLTKGVAWLPAFPSVARTERITGRLIYKTGTESPALIACLAFDVIAVLYLREDVGPDGLHPSAQGQQKIAKLMIAFFKSDAATKRWFVR